GPPLERALLLAPARSGEVLFPLIELAARDGRMRDLDSLSALFLALDHASDLAPVVRTLLAVVHRDSSRLAVSRRELRGMNTEDAWRVIGVVTSAAVGRGKQVTDAELLRSFPHPKPAHEQGTAL